MEPKGLYGSNRKVRFLGAIIGQQKYVPTAKVHRKYKEAVEKGQRKKIEGYESYFNDLYEDGVQQGYTHSDDRIIVDGQKRRFSASILLCGACNEIKKGITKSVVQASQATSEQTAIMLGITLAQREGLENIYTDHNALVVKKEDKANTINHSVAEFARKRQVRLIHTKGGSNNVADEAARTGKIKRRCKCNSETTKMETDDSVHRMSKAHKELTKEKVQKEDKNHQNVQ